tara:strand:- start:1091 stop:1429 length:339 start_codon:yes stop_codon:yes gene_type:complete
VIKIIVLYILLISGCGTLTGYNFIAESYHGIPESELIRTWGIPSKIYESGDSRFLIYSKLDTAMFGLIEERITCKTTFEIKNKTVTSSNFEGSQCWGKEKYDSSYRKFNPPY